MRSIFGWSYPPGAAGDPNAPWNQDEGPCAVCAKDVAECVCPECPVCGSTGDPACYHDHGLKLSREQAIFRQYARIATKRAALRDEELALEQLKSGADFSDDLADSPDPWG